jgi:hypothetical protein
MNKDLDILKAILSEAEGDEVKAAKDKEKEVKKNDAEEKVDDRANEKEDKPDSAFDKDPMGFILKKYHTLNELLMELMTPAFKEYLTAIFIQSPKPTSFKIVLHNSQYFYLIYMGDGIYEAVIAGKRHYLSSIGEKERAMKGISRLLQQGSPLKTKGPEGAEEGTRPDGEDDGSLSGGNNNGGGDQTGVETTPAAEEGGEDENEPLTESVILKSIIKEALTMDLRNSLNSEMKKMNLPGDKGKKKPDHLRYQLGTDPSKSLAKAADKVIGKGNYTMADVKKGTKDSASGTYPTIKITVTKATPSFKKGESVLIVNQTGQENKTVTFKSLTPVNLGIAGEYKDLNSVVNATTKAVQKDKNLGKILTALVTDTAKNTPVSKSGLSKLKSGKVNVPLSKQTTPLLSSISTQDKNTIGKDFGEILGGIFLGKHVGIKKGLDFPKGNEPLVDFYIDGYKISSKYEKGATASLTDLLKAIDVDQIKGEKNQYALYKALLPMLSETSPNAFLKVASAFPKDMPAITTLASIIGVDAKDLTAQKINDYLKKLFAKTNANTAAKKDAVFFKKFNPFFNQTKRLPGKGAKVDWDTMKKKTGDNGYYGAITSPLSYYVADQMNTKPKFVEALKDIISKTEVKQMYLTFDLKDGGSMTFDIRSFNDPNAKFKFDIPSLSTLNPTSSKLGFSLSK